MRQLDGRTAARLTAWAIAPLVLVGCESADRRSFDERIDQREADMTQRVELYETFEAELLAELREEYGATAEGGCPEVEALPGIGSMTGGRGSREEYQQRLEREAQARREVFLRNLPGERCLCLQETLPHVRRALERSDLDQFAEVREEIAAMSDEALTQRVALGGLPAADGFPPDVAQDRIDSWKARRHEDWIGDAEAWGDEEPFGWQDFNYQPRASSARIVLSTDRPLLTGLTRNYADYSCDRF